jgi:WD40 repeat protein
MKPRRAKPNSIFSLKRIPIFDIVPLPGGHDILCARDTEGGPPSAGTVERWNLKTGKRGAVFTGHTDTVRGVALAFGGTRVVSAGFDAVRVWDLKRATCLATFPMAAEAVAVTDDGTHALVTLTEQIVLIDLESGRQVRDFTAHKSRVMEVAIVPGLGQFVSASLDCRVGLWDIVRGKRVRWLDANPKRKKFVSRMGTENPESATSVSVMADRRRLIAGYGDGAIRCWDLATGTILHDATCGKVWVMSVAASPHDQVLIGAWDGKVRLWQPGEADVTELGEHDGEVSAVAFLDDGSRAVSGSFDEALRVWDIARGKCVEMIGEPRVSGLRPPTESEW